MKESRLLSIALASCAILSLSPTTGSGAQERILASEEDTALSIRFAKEHSHPIPRREAYAERLMLQYPVLVEQLLNKVRVKRLPAGSTLEIYDERPSLTPGTTNVRARHVHKGIVVVGEEVILGVTH